MSEPIEIILKPNNQLLRLFCGQCGDSVDIILDVDPDDNKRITIRIQDTIDFTQEENPQMFLKPIEIIV